MSEIKEKKEKYEDIMSSFDVRHFMFWLGKREISSLRLPFNNKEALDYLRWLNESPYMEGCTFLNYCINIFDQMRVKPPTPLEMSVSCARHIVELESKRDYSWETYIDWTAGFIRDANLFNNCHLMRSCGLAAAYMKWGTWEDNEKPGDPEVKDYMEWDKW